MTPKLLIKDTTSICKTGKVLTISHKLIKHQKDVIDSSTEQEKNELAAHIIVCTIRTVVET